MKFTLNPDELGITIDMPNGEIAKRIGEHLGTKRVSFTRSSWRDPQPGDHFKEIFCETK